MLKLHKIKGQGLVEFALILPALLMILFSIIEGAFLFQAYLAVQHAAREGARYATTYQPPITYSEAQGKMLQVGDNPGTPAYPNESQAHWELRRTQLIREHVHAQAMGLRVLHTALGFADPAGHTDVDASYMYDSGWNNIGEGGFFGVEVWGFPSLQDPEEIDHPSLPGLPVKVVVSYRWVPIDPIIALVVPDGVLLTGEAIMINEGIQVGMGAVAPPTFSTISIGGPPQLITGTPGGGGSTAVPTATSTSTPTATPTNTPTPTSTPTSAYIILAPERDRWPQDEIPNGTVKLFNHNDGGGPYEIWWTDNCNHSTYLGFALTTTGGASEWSMPSPGSVSPSFKYLSDQCGSIVLGKRYKGYLSSRLANGTIVAQQEIGIYEPIKPPDLTIKQIIVPADLEGGGQFFINVEIENTQNAAITDTFEVDIYIDPNYAPVRKGQQGIGTKNGSSPKQWVVGMAPNSTKVLTYVVSLPPTGGHTLWAQVDTGDLIDELDDDTNNIAGPVDLNVPCSDQCDSFDAAALDSKWIYSPVGSASGVGQALVNNGELFIYGQGESLWRTYDGRFHMLHQGAYEGDFEMTVRVMEYANERSSAKTGLMVRESLVAGARYIAIAVRNDYGAKIQTFWRRSVNGEPDELCSYVALPNRLFDGDDSNGEGVLLRITRQGDDLTLAYAFDGGAWYTPSCMQRTLSNFADPAVPGIFIAPYKAP